VFTAIMVFMELLLLFIVVQGGPLTPLAVASMVLVAAVSLWTIRGNRRLADDARRLADDIRAGAIKLDKFCDLPLVTAVIVYREKLYLPKRGEA